MTSVALFLVVGLLFACVMLVLGIVCGLCLGMRNNLPAAAAPISGAVGPHEQHEQLAAQRAQVVSRSLLRAIEKMAGNVSAHSTRIEEISSGLRQANDTSADGLSVLIRVPEQILVANFELQQQLARAKRHIEKQAAQLRARESEARTDALTMLLNRRAFEEELRKQLSVWERKATSFALITLDIDHFKDLNDRHGHQVGDEVLREVAHVIVEQLREMDIAFRYGGEEFAVILPATYSDEAGIVAERIRSAIEGLVVPYAEKQLNVTMSAGVAAVETADDPDKIFKRADEALYSAKKAGRNCVHIHNLSSIMPRDKTAALEAPLSREAKSSPVTSINNLNRELTRQVCESRRHKTPLSLVSVRLGRSNCTENVLDPEETFRYVVPELIAASRLQLERADLLVPMSAEEFVVVLPGRTRSAAIEFIERVVDGIESNAIGSQVRYAACELFPQETAQQLLDRARSDVLLTATSEECLDHVALL